VEGREEEFLALIERYARVVASAIRRVCGRHFRTLVPDVEQDVYAALWAVVRSGKKIRHPSSYLYKVALTTALAAVRRSTPEMTTITIDEDDAATVPAAREGAGGFGDLLPAEQERLLAQVLEQLSPEEGRAVRAHLAGFSHTEVAALYGWSDSVARHRIYRGIETLRKRMRP
jgi:RNA polymerase sigma-70 factor, ECF subfamily